MDKHFERAQQTKVVNGKTYVLYAGRWHVKPESFPGYPHLRRVTQSAQYGRMELLDVSRTSDGFLIGTARIGTGRAAYVHSVFLGEDPRCQRSATQPHDVTCDRHPENK